METFRVIFSGDVLPDQDTNQVAKRFAAAFNLRDINALKHLFSGKVITLKKGLNYEHAQRYRNILLEMGAECCIEKEFNPLYQPSEDLLTDRRKKKRPSLFGKTDLSNVGITPKEGENTRRQDKVTFI